ncbi:hypothetical protein GPECTOR_65g165 [Gonium pectorale]|uniref:Helicase ATP-binding domain-containing protein n=1 Tax=Gonium pectorale TaxID=33097 RepID=A0A150G3W8_GONPE|nr:hypothetical protein GPECTOR_65g165 [Gonium pectorale]|eukprot:KXZ44547.1 hypothetical protein GPECTOR_65g165 [Gonium pectorale]
MLPPAAAWSAELQPLHECGVLPCLPPLTALLAALPAGTSPGAAAGGPTGKAAAASGAGRAAAAGGADGASFDASAVYDAALQAVQREAGGKLTAGAAVAAALCIAAAVCEHAEGDRSRRARHATVLPPPGPSAFVGPQPQPDAGGSSGGESDGDVDGNVDSDGNGNGNGDAPSLRDFLQQLTRAQIADTLVELLREGPAGRQTLERLVDELGVGGVAAVLEDTLAVSRSGKRSDDLFRKDGVQRYKASGAAVEAAAAAAEQPLETMRPYQRDTVWAWGRVGVGMVLAGWGLPLTRGLLRAGQWLPAAAAAAVGGAAQRVDAAAYRGLGGDWAGNWLVCAPTNSGKTLMMVEVARGVIAAATAAVAGGGAAAGGGGGGGGGALVVVLVPTVILTAQHRAYFERAALPNTVVLDVSSDRKLPADEWRDIAAPASAAAGRPAGRSHVLICTAGAFLHLLNLGGEEDGGGAGGVSGVSYSGWGWGGARGALGAAPPAVTVPKVDLLVLDEAHHCQGDHAYAAVVQALTQAAAGAAGAGTGPSTRPPPRILGLTASPVSERDSDFAIAIAESIERDAAAGTGLAAAGAGAAAEVATLRQWQVRGRAVAGRYGCPRLDLSCRLVDILFKAAEMTEDVGCEGALTYLARKAAALCRAELRTERSAAERQGYFADAANGGGGGGDGAPLEPRALSELRALAAELPSPNDAAATAASGALPPPLSGDRVSDLGSKTSAWLARLLLAQPAPPGSRSNGGDGGGGAAGAAISPLAALLQPPPASDEERWSARLCFSAPEHDDDAATGGALPKLAALVDYVAAYAGRPSFHGVVFVRTRQAVFLLADALRRSERLRGVEVLELVGQGSQSAASEADLLPGERDRASRGMGGRAQLRALQRFRGAGRKLLLATSAAEEGLDVPSCEFVVRYNAAATGTQLRQSRGRARVRGAEFLSILQESTLDEQLYGKSQAEEAQLREYTRRQASQGW